MKLRLLHQHTTSDFYYSGSSNKRKLFLRCINSSRYVIQFYIGYSPVFRDRNVEIRKL